MSGMRRVAALFAILSLVSLASVAAPRQERFANPLLDDVVEMTRAEVPDATILAFLRARRARLDSDVSAQDLIRLHRAGVHDEVVAYIAGQAGLEEPSEPAPVREEPPPAAPETPAASEPADSEPVPVDDGGLVMGVYDPIPVNDYPCWPPGWWGAGSDACGGAIFVGGGGFAGRGGHAGRRRDHEGDRPETDRRRGGAEPRGGGPGRDRPDSDRGGRGSGSGSGHGGGHGGHPGGGRGAY